MRFLEKGIDGLMDAPRSGAPQTFTLTQRCELISLACDPPGAEEGASACQTLDELTRAACQKIDGPAMSRSSV
jgi:hypothetical protein